MSDQSHVCPKCKAVMENGFVMDFSIGGMGPSHWHPGIRKKSVLTGTKMDKSKIVPTTSYRCTSCGFLESYAVK